MATTGSGTSTPAASPIGSYTLAQLCTMWRERLDDETPGYLWENSELTQIADGIQKDLCAEMHILEDRTTAGIAVVSLVQGDGLISLSPRITAIKRAQIDGETQTLQIQTAEYMDSVYGVDWDSASVTQAAPTIMVTEGVGYDKAYLYPPLDDATGTLKMTVYRLPLVDLDYTAHSGQALELDKFAHLFVHGVMWKAYLNQDSEAYDPKKAESHRVLWEGVNGHGGDKEKIRRMVLRRNAQPKSASPMAAYM